MYKRRYFPHHFQMWKCKLSHLKDDESFHESMIHDGVCKVNELGIHIINSLSLMEKQHFNISNSYVYFEGYVVLRFTAGFN